MHFGTAMLAQPSDIPATGNGPSSTWPFFRPGYWCRDPSLGRARRRRMSAQLAVGPHALPKNERGIMEVWS